jgi:hypothetical protein
MPPGHADIFGNNGSSSPTLDYIDLMFESLSIASSHFGGEKR